MKLPSLKNRLGTTFSALKHPNYRLWFWGQMVSLFGTWMQTTAQGFLVYDLTQSPAYLGYVGFAAGLPVWLFMLYAGVVADRVPRRDLIMICQTVMMVLAFILAALTFTGIVRPWHIVVLAFLLGTANAFDAPARQSFVLEMVNREDLSNAIALNGTMFNTATAIGPAVGGLAYAILGPAWCFAVNGITFIAVIYALRLMRLESIPAKTKESGALESFLEGFRYLRKNDEIVSLTLLEGAFCLFGITFLVTLFPAWAVEILRGDARVNGMLQTSRGIGAFAGALFIASLGNFRFKGKLLTLGTFAFPVALVFFSLSRLLGTALVLLVFAGVAQIFILNLCNTLVQGLTSDEYRGRVMGVYTFSFFGAMPGGSLLAGFLGQYLSLPQTILFGSGVCLIVAAAAFVFKPKLRTLY